jgi:lysophospholipase L1-like esterase
LTVEIFGVYNQDNIYQILIYASLHFAIMEKGGNGQAIHMLIFDDIHIMRHNRIRRLIHRLTIYVLSSFSVLLCLLMLSAFPRAHASSVPAIEMIEGEPVSFEAGDSLTVFIPFASQGGAFWPDYSHQYPTPSATQRSSSSTSTSVPESTPSPTSPPGTLPMDEPTISPSSTPTPTYTSTPTPTATFTSTPSATLTLTPTPTQDDQACQEPVRIMPLGDSITRGSGSTNTNGYRRELYSSFTQEGHWVDFVGGQQDGSDDFDRQHEGHSGWSADGGSQGSIASSVYDFLIYHPAEIVLLHIGTNDIQEGHQDPADVSLILDEIRRYSIETQVVLALIINQATYSPETTLYNAQVRELAQERIDMGHALLLVDMENALSYPDDMADSVHPNDNGYIKMAGVWFEALSGTLPVCPDR